MKNNFKSTLLILFVIILLSNVAMAKRVDVRTARTVASNSLKNVDSRVESSSLSLVYTREQAFYVFGHANGFVIVAAEDRVQPILGYSNESPFVVPQIGDTTFGNNFWGWMKSLEDQITYVTLNPQRKINKPV